MIDPSNITNFNLNKYQLQEMLIFWILVAGKTAKTTARLLENMFQKLYEKYGTRKPFHVLRMYNKDHPGELEDLLKSCGFGCHKIKARGIRELLKKDYDLKTCTVQELESIYSIGPKTARCFIMHTRPGVRHAGLDTHCLKWLKSLGYKVPKSTPTGKKYLELEKVFLDMADELKMSPSELDLMIWNHYSKN